MAREGVGWRRRKRFQSGKAQGKTSGSPSNAHPAGMLLKPKERVGMRHHRLGMHGGGRTVKPEIVDGVRERPLIAKNPKGGGTE